MQKDHRTSSKKYERCPECGSVFVDWDPNIKRYRCLEHTCDWRESRETDPGEYNYATGTSWTPSIEQRRFLG
jgi:hypothetical protein